MSEPMTDERRKEIEKELKPRYYVGEKVFLLASVVRECLEEIERLKDEQCDACASNHHEMENLKEENSKLRELLEEIYLFAPLSKIRAFLDGEESK